MSTALATKQNNIASIMTKKEATEDEIKAVIESQREAIRESLPAYMTAEKFTRIVFNCFSRNPELFKCTPQSVVGAVMTLAQLGLDPDLGLAHLVPFNSKVNGTWMKLCQLIIDYKGFLQLIMNTGMVKDAYAEIVYSGDYFEETLGSHRELRHKKPPIGQDRGTPIAYYAVISLLNGGRLYKVMTKEEVIEHAKKYSKQKDKITGELNNLWKLEGGEFDKMALKTTVRQVAKFAPKSTNLLRSINRDGTITEKLSTDMSYSQKQIELQREPFSSSQSPAVGRITTEDWLGDDKPTIQIQATEKKQETPAEDRLTIHKSKFPETPQEETDEEFIDNGQKANFAIKQNEYGIPDEVIAGWLIENGYSPTGSRATIYKSKFLEAKKGLKGLAKELANKQPESLDDAIKQQTLNTGTDTSYLEG